MQLDAGPHRVCLLIFHLYELTHRPAASAGRSIPAMINVLLHPNLTITWREKKVLLEATLLRIRAAHLKTRL
jgi:hypothetical protein